MMKSTPDRPAHATASTPPSRAARLGGAAAAITVVSGTVFVGGQPVGAATFEVTTLDAAGAGSLAERTAEANALPGLDTITFAPGLSGEVDVGAVALGISDDLIITGPGSGALTLTSQDTADVLYLYNGAALTVSGLTIDDAAGSAIVTSGAGDLTVSDVHIVDSRLTGINVVESGAVTISDSLIGRSGEAGLDVLLSGDVTVTDTSVSFNVEDGVSVDEGGDIVIAGLVSVANGFAGVELDNVGSVTIAGADSRFDDDDSFVITDAGATSITDVAVTLSDTAFDINEVVGPLTIERVTVDRALRDGLDVTNVSGDVTIRDMSFTNIYEVGIDIATVGTTVAPADVVIDQVSTQHTGDEGVDVSSVSGSLDVTDVSVTDVFDSEAIDVFDVDGPITMERLDLAGADGGIDISGSASAVLRDVSARLLRGDAIDVSVTGDVVIERSDVVDVYDGGIDLFSSAGAVTLSDATVTTAHDGIEIDGETGVTVTDVSVTNALDDNGLDVDSDVGDILAERIIVDFTDVDGVNVQQAGGDVILRDITTSNTDNEGIEVGSVTGTTTIERVAVSDSQGDGILVEASTSGPVSISDTTVEATGSDGIRFLGSAGATLRDVDIENAGAIGLGLSDVGGPSTIDAVTVTGAKGRGVAGFNSGDLTFTNSTIADNAVGSVERGAGIDLNNTDATITASTITDNSGSLDGGAVFRRNGASATVVSSIVVANDGLAAFADNGTAGSLTVENTLVDVGTGLGGTTIETSDALLGPVRDNGGATRTAKPESGSPAIDAVTGTPEPIDQRGVTRPQGPAADLGAVEVAAGVVGFDPATVTVDESAGTVDLMLVRTGGADGAATVDVAVASGTASVGADVAAVAQAVEFADGVTSAIVSVPVIDDGDVESDETFTVTISNPTVVAIGALATATVTITDDDVEEAPEAPAPSADAVITSLTPSRFADTRANGETFDDIAEKTGKLAAGGEIVVPIAGRGGVPADAVGVVMNVTAIQAESVGFVTAHACLDDRPNTSALNYTSGVNLGNEVIASLDANGAVCLFSSASAHLAVDVVGYISASSPLQTVTPARLVDTRTSGVTADGVDQGGGPTEAGENRTIGVAGRAEVPADAAAVIVNVTAVGATSNGFVTVHPCVDPVPTASSLNHVAGVNRGNELVASLDADGNLCVFTSSSVNLTIDVVGYIPAGTNFSPVAPARLFDSRLSQSTVDGEAPRTTKLAAGEDVRLPVAGRAGVPGDATAAIVNITAVAADGVGFVTAHPCVEPRPNASSLNFVAGVNGGNEVIASLDADGDLCLFASATTHLTVDVVGYLA